MSTQSLTRPSRCAASYPLYVWAAVRSSRRAAPGAWHPPFNSLVEAGHPQPSPASPLTIFATLQRLLKDCEEKAELAKRPSAAALAQQGGASSRRGSEAAVGRSGGTSGSSEGSEEESDESSDTREPAAAARAGGAPVQAAANGGPAAVVSSGAEASSGSDGEAAAGSGGEFVPNLDKLKKLGKRAGPGEGSLLVVSRQCCGRAAYSALQFGITDAGQAGWWCCICLASMAGLLQHCIRHVAC